VFTSYADGARYTGLDSDETMFILVRLEPRAQIEEVLQSLKNRLSDHRCLDAKEFSQKAQL